VWESSCNWKAPLLLHLPLFLSIYTHLLLHFFPHHLLVTIIPPSLTSKLKIWNSPPSSPFVFYLPFSSSFSSIPLSSSSIPVPGNCPSRRAPWVGLTSARPFNSTLKTQMSSFLKNKRGCSLNTDSI
jgi:hypothetical protein